MSDDDWLHDEAQDHQFEQNARTNAHDNYVNKIYDLGFRDGRIKGQEEHIPAKFLEGLEQEFPLGQASGKLEGQIDGLLILLNKTNTGKSPEEVAAIKAKINLLKDEFNKNKRDSNSLNNIKDQLAQYLSLFV